MVTLPVLVVRPAAILSTLLVLSLKSPAEARVPAAAATVIVIGEDTALAKLAVTLVVAPSSVIVGEDSIRVTAGMSSVVLADTRTLSRLSYLVSPLLAGSSVIL